MRIAKKPSEAGLNLLWPGLAQIAQGRTSLGIFFLVEAVAGLAMCVWVPESRPFLFVALALQGAWSLADAYLYERRS